VKKSILFFAAIASFHVHAAQVSCQASKNLDVQWSHAVTTQVGQRVEIGSVEDYDFLLKEVETGRFEIEVFDPYTPARQYANGVIDKANGLKWSLWTREILLEIDCRI
jgi:hypothetical protein